MALREGTDAFIAEVQSWEEPSSGEQVRLFWVQAQQGWSWAGKQADNILGRLKFQNNLYTETLQHSGSQDTPFKVFDVKAQFNATKWPQSVECNLGLHF